MRNAENLSLEEIRELCGLVIDEGKIMADKECREFDEEELRSIEKSLTMLFQRPIKRTTRSKPPLLWKLCPPAVVDACLGPVMYAVKLLINLFAMVVLRVDHRMLNFRYDKQPVRASLLLDCLGAPWIPIGEYERYGGFNMKHSPYLHYMKVMREQPEMLERTRLRIMEDEQAARTLYAWLQGVAYQEEPYWTHLYFRLEELGVEATYTQESRERMLGVFRADNPYQENCIKRVMNAYFGDSRAVLEEVEPLQIDIQAEQEREQLDRLPRRKEDKSKFMSFLEGLAAPPSIPGNGPTDSGWGSDDRDQNW